MVKSILNFVKSYLNIYTFVVSRAFMAGADSQVGEADSFRAPGLTSDLQGSENVHVVLYCWCRSDSASVLLYFTLKCANLYINESNISYS